MEKFIAYEKLSKKEQKKLNSAKRGNWGLVKPITKAVSYTHLRAHET